MSYEPDIIIEKKDLEKQRKHIEEVMNSIRYSKIQRKWNQDAYEELEKALEHDTIKFPKFEIVIISPELTSHNRAVRELLDDLKISYRIND